jgi:hypothetical protein
MTSVADARSAIRERKAGKGPTVGSRTEERQRMTKSTHPLSATVVRDFCALCDKAHEYWINHLELFDDNPRNAELCNSSAGREWERLSIISQEYGLLQIRKLHDPAVMSGKITLGIDYVLKYGGWSDSVLSRLETLEKELCDFGKQLLDVRNKILSHNDLATIVKRASLGGFKNGPCEKYFKDLQDFVNTVHGEVIGGNWWFDNRIKSDVAAFLATIKPA